MLPCRLSIRSAYEDSISAARSQLGDKTFAAAWAEGRTMTPEQALAAQSSVTTPTATLGKAIIDSTSEAIAYLSRRPDRP